MKIMIDGVLRDMTLEEIAEFTPTQKQLDKEQILLAINKARNDIKVDPFVQTFINMTAAEVTSYINTTVTDLASAKNVLQKLALMLLYIAKKEYRN